MNADWTWEKTRELYTDWLAEWGDSSKIKEHITWKGFPLWWVSLSVVKDNEVNYEWFKEIHLRLSGGKPNQFKNYSGITIVIGIIISIGKETGKWLLLRLLPKADSSNKDNTIWFHSLEYNLLGSENEIVDRMYDKVHLKDDSYGFYSAFIVRLFFNRKCFLRPIQWLNKVKSYERRLGRKTIILDSYLKFSDIISIHYSLLKNYLKFRMKILPMLRNKVTIGGVDVSDIILHEFTASFLSTIPWALSYGAMFNNWLGSGGNKLMITYAETLAPFRAVYHFTKAHPGNHCWMSIQHATIYKNKLSFYHRYSEFNSKPYPSPQPDYYFIHGEQFARILKEYYPEENTRIIGCLKYDYLHKINENIATIKAEVTEQVNADSRRVLLLAPSVNDVEDLLSYLRQVDIPDDWRVFISLHPVSDPCKVRNYIEQLQFNCEVEFPPGIATQKLLTIADLVICGYSSVALEAAIFDVPSVRILPTDRPPLTEGEKHVKYFTGKEQFRIYMESFFKQSSENISYKTHEMVTDYFSIIDGKACERFWQNLLLIAPRKS